MGFDVNEAERKHTRYSFHGTETKLLVSSSKPWIHEGFLWIHMEINWNPLEKEFDKSLYLLIIVWKTKLPLEAIMRLNSKNKT